MTSCETCKKQLPYDDLDHFRSIVNDEDGSLLACGVLCDECLKALVKEWLRDDCHCKKFFTVEDYTTIS